jgi:hypothetical protein
MARRTAPGGRLAAAIAVLAIVPYAALKVAWLAGSTVGSASAEGAAELHDARHTVGNVVTLGMELVVVALALVLAADHRHRVPAALVAVPIWIGTGLLGPVALSLPIGLVVQAIVGGGPAPGDNGLQPWVYGIVYGGFVVQALALAAAFVLYARVRWAAVLQLDVRTLALRQAPRRSRAVVQAAVLAAGVAAVANLVWAIAGDRLAAPSGFETAAQRSLLVGTAVLTIAGAWAVRRIADPPAGRRALFATAPTLAVAWLGTSAAFASGIAHLVLAADGEVAPVTALVLALGTASGLTLACTAVARLARARATR